MTTLNFHTPKGIIRKKKANLYRQFAISSTNTIKEDKRVGASSVNERGKTMVRTVRLGPFCVCQYLVDGTDI
jgi:hypothetical protein